MYYLLFILSLIYNLSAGTPFSFIFSGMISLILLVLIGRTRMLIITGSSLILLLLSVLSVEGAFIFYGISTALLLKIKKPPYRFMLNLIFCIVILSILSGRSNQSGLLQGLYFKPNNFAVAVSSGVLLLRRLVVRNEISRNVSRFYSAVFLCAAILTGSRVAILIAIIPYLELIRKNPLIIFALFMFAWVIIEQGLLLNLMQKLSRRQNILADERFIIWSEVFSRLEWLRYADLKGIEKGLHNTVLFYFTNLGIIIGAALSGFFLVRTWKSIREFGFLLSTSVVLYLNVEVIAYKELWIVLLFFIAEYNTFRSKKPFLNGSDKAEIQVIN